MLPENQNKEFTSEVKLHLKEADDMKKQWYSYVFTSISSLSDKVEATALRVEKERAEVLEKLNVLRDILTEEIKKSSNGQTKELEKTEYRLEKTVDSINGKLKQLNTLDIKLQIDEHFKIATCKFEEDTKKQLKVLSDAQLIMKTKVGVYAVVVSLITTAIVTTIAGGFFPLIQSLWKSSGG